MERIAEIERNTKETQIKLTIQLALQRLQEVMVLEVLQAYLQLEMLQ